MKIKPYVHKVQYYETDQMAVVHHSNYIRWMEEARSDLLEQMGLGYLEIEQMGLLSPVLGISCSYKSSARYADLVRIECALTSYNGFRFSVSYEMWDENTGVLCLEGTSDHCFLDKEGRPVSVKRKFPEVDEMFIKMVQIEEK